MIFEMKRMPMSFLRWETKPCQVCGEPATSYHGGATGEDAYLNGHFCAEHTPQCILRMPETKEVITFEGPCDVCGQLLTMTFDYVTGGMIDTGATEDGVLYTWRRHGEEGPNQPDCDRYSSRVYETGRVQVPLTEQDKAEITERFQRSDW